MYWPSPVKEKIRKIKIKSKKKKNHLFTHKSSLRMIKNTILIQFMLLSLSSLNILPFNALLYGRIQRLFLRGSI